MSFQDIILAIICSSLLGVLNSLYLRGLFSFSDLIYFLGPYCLDPHSLLFRIGFLSRVLYRVLVYSQFFFHISVCDVFHLVVSLYPIHSQFFLSRHLSEPLVDFQLYYLFFFIIWIIVFVLYLKKAFLALVYGRIPVLVTFGLSINFFSPEWLSN